MDIDELLSRMKSMLDDLDHGDTARLFHSTYTRATLAVRDEIRLPSISPRGSPPRTKNS